MSNISGMHVGLVAGMGAHNRSFVDVMSYEVSVSILSLLIFMTPICTILSGFLYGCRVGWPPSAQSYVDVECVCRSQIFS